MNQMSTKPVNRQDLEREIFDLKNLLIISKSLNSTLDYNILTDSILYTCLGSLSVVKAGFLSKKSIDSVEFSLHRNYLGFDLDHNTDYSISEKDPLIDFLNKNSHCHTLEELRDKNTLGDFDLRALEKLAPSIIVPMRAKGQINGILVLGDKIEGTEFTPHDKDYLENIANFAAIAIHNAFLFEMTTTDMMTKLKMKHFFMNSLHEKMENCQNGDLSVVMLDIDHFKVLNDTYGHLTGDEVLKQVARVIQETVRQVDIAARYGGEEFIVLLPDANISLAKIVAERIRRNIAERPTIIEGQRYPVTVSLGVAQYDPQRDLTERHLIERADQALYRSKEHGRNQTSVAQ
jgi:two-component system cell cycle response regulator